MYEECDLGLGHARLIDLQSTTVRVSPARSVGTGFEEDLYFNPSHSLSTYAEAARRNGAITDDPRLLDATQGPR